MLAPGLRAIKLNQIGYVLAAAECRSFRRAARRLNVEQSSVSRRVRELEIQLGASIFERSRGGVRLTEVGEQFVIGAAAAVGHFEEAAQLVGEAGRTQATSLRVGVAGPLGEGTLRSWLQRLAAEPQAPRITLQEASGERHLADLEAGRLDIAFVIGGPGGHNLCSAPAWLERLFLATPVDHPLAARRSVGWRDFIDERLVFSNDAHGEALQAFVRRRAGGEAVKIACHGAGRESLRFLVGIGQGLTVVMAERGDEETHGIVLTPVRRERLQVSAIWSPRNERASLKRFLRLATLAASPS
ncbi:hypothetical protein AS593_06680 [Caulobacter vibrioides]|nr:hypothetical protein AS593_06680 [Caulobacter vibrioides]